jgi:hypothetical protein
VNSTLTTSQYGEGNNITQIGEKVLANYATSFIPTLSGQVARSIDTTRRKSYVESGADLSVFRSALEQVENKIPFLSRTNIPYRDVWGNADTSSQGWAIIENFLSPGYGNELKNDPVTNELKRLYEETGDKNLIPKTASKTVSVGGETVKLNAEQYDKYVVTRGQTAKTVLEDLIERPEYVALTNDNPEAQAQLIKDVWEYANAVARHELFPDYKMDSWISKAYATGQPIDAIFDREETKAKNAYITSTNNELFTSIDTQDADAIAACVEGLKQAGKDDKSIRTTVMNHYRDAYKTAFLNEDEDAMDAIRYGLEYLDLGDYTIDDDVFDKWEQDAIDKLEGNK